MSAVTPEREAAHAIAEVLYRITRECGRPLVLTAEDRDEIEGIVRKAGADVRAALLQMSIAFNFAILDGSISGGTENSEIANFAAEVLAASR